MFAAALLALCLTTSGQRFEPADWKPAAFVGAGKDRLFVQGVNLPWFDGEFDHDIGKNPLRQDTPVWYRKDVVERYLADIAAMNLSVVRVWLFERLEGWVLDGGGRLKGLDPTLLKNLDHLASTAAKHRLKLYLCLSGSYGDLKQPSPITDLAAQRAYIDRAVRPLARRLKGNPAIFAFDVINEIESDVAGRTGNWTPNGATWKQARAFIGASVLAIKSEDPWRLVSSGSGWHSWENVRDGLYSGLGLDFYDVHVYDDKGFLPPARELNADRPVILGEFGQSSKEWDDAAQAKAHRAFIESVVRKGYAGYLVWTYGHEGTPEVHSLIGKSGEHRPAVVQLRSLAAAIRAAQSRTARFPRRASAQPQRF